MKTLGRTQSSDSLAFQLGIAAIVAVCYVTLTVSCFPPFGVAEAAYAFTIPFLVWCFFKPGKWLYGAAAMLGSWAAWFVILIWLRHVHPPFGWVATTLLSFAVGCFPAIWLMAARWTLPRMIERTVAVRLSAMLGLAGTWVLLEWTRTWLFTGFPWLPLAGSQWERPAMLQIAAWTGHYGVGFVIILVNLGLVFYGYSLVRQIRRKSQSQTQSTLDRKSARDRFDTYGKSGKSLLGFKFAFCPEFYLGLGALMFCFGLYAFNFEERAGREPMFRAAAVQPWIPATLKWDQAAANDNLRVLQQQTEYAALLRPDVILWPEAATPFPLIDDRDDGMLQWTERLVNRIDTPILAGALSMMNSELFNGVYWIRPGEGLQELYYHKRHPVPFGEYAPLRDYLPFIGKVVPLDNDIVAAEDAVVIPTEFNGQPWPVGMMICNEDIYPGLARDMALNGASWLLVVTNDAWYGTEAGAYQHAANSVLRAVETRLPVIRCGNHGWTGWIDEFGQIRNVLTDGRGSIYFRGVGPLEITRATAFAGTKSFYVRHGNWFVALSGVLVVLAIVLLRRRPSTGQ